MYIDSPQFGRYQNLHMPNKLLPLTEMVNVPVLFRRGMAHFLKQHTDYWKSSSMKMDAIWLEISATTISSKNIKINTALLIKNTYVIFRRNIINLDRWWSSTELWEQRNRDKYPTNYLLNYKYTHAKWILSYTIKY